MKFEKYFRGLGCDWIVLILREKISTIIWATSLLAISWEFAILVTFFGNSLVCPACSRCSIVGQHAAGTCSLLWLPYENSQSWHFQLGRWLASGDLCYQGSLESPIFPLPTWKVHVFKYLWKSPSSMEVILFWSFIPLKKLLLPPDHL